MKLEDDLEEIIKLAHNASPTNTEYYLARLLRNTPAYTSQCSHCGEEEWNKNHSKLENLISYLRSSKI